MYETLFRTMNHWRVHSSLDKLIKMLQAQVIQAVEHKLLVKRQVTTENSATRSKPWDLSLTCDKRSTQAISERKNPQSRSYRYSFRWRRTSSNNWTGGVISKKLRLLRPKLISKKRIKQFESSQPNLSRIQSKKHRLLPGKQKSLKLFWLLYFGNWYFSTFFNTLLISALITQILFYYNMRTYFCEIYLCTIIWKVTPGLS